MIEHVLKSGKEKTEEDVERLAKYVVNRAPKKKTQMFFGEFISPNELLGRQLKLRLDLVVRDLAIGQILGENTIGLELWKKLGARTRTDYHTRVLRLQELMTSFKKRGGYIARHPIPVNGDYQLRGGSHRMVLSKRYNILEIPIFGSHLHNFRTKYKSKGFYTIPVMRRIGFTTEEIKYLWSLKDEFYGIT